MFEKFPPQMSRLRRYRRRLTKALSGKHSRTVKLDETLTGSAADTWNSLREAAERQAFSDQELIVLLLLRAARKVRAELLTMDQE